MAGIFDKILKNVEKSIAPAIKKLDRPAQSGGGSGGSARAAESKPNEPKRVEEWVPPPPVKKPEPTVRERLDQDPNAESQETQKNILREVEKQRQQELKEMTGKEGSKTPPGSSAVAAEAQAKADKDAAAEERDRARDAGLGRVPGEELKPADVDQNSYVMTDADYNALNDMSRAGVDANTVIMEALRAGNVSTELRTRLKQLRLPSGKKVVDEYTSLQALVDDKDITNILSDKGTASLMRSMIPLANPVGAALSGIEINPLNGNRRVGLVTELASAAKELRARLPKNALSAGFDIAAQLQRTPDMDLPAGWGDTEQDVAIREMFDALSDKSTPMEDIEAYLARGAAANSNVLSYVDRRSQNEKNYGIKPGKGRRSPEELRKLLGLDRGDENG